MRDTREHRCLTVCGAGSNFLSQWAKSLDELYWQFLFHCLEIIDGLHFRIVAGEKIGAQYEHIKRAVASTKHNPFTSRGKGNGGTRKQTRARPLSSTFNRSIQSKQRYFKI